MKPSEMALVSNYRWQERPNRSTNNGDMDDNDKRPMSE